jgi:aryl-alcohol dehydrogenase-like predicted oxidoreductase
MRIPKETFGRTGHQSTRTIFGAAALSRVTQEEADRALGILLEYGVNHIDTAPSYGDAELRIGPWMAEHRTRFFLATKTGERTRAGAREELERSLERLRVDQVDLLQFHHLVDAEAWEVAMGPGGALDAAIEAREQGLVRFIGVTGHGTRVAEVHLRSLERFDFDSVLLPYNFTMMQSPDYAVAAENLLARCRAGNVAVQTIKSVARRRWDGDPGPRATWYEPLEDPLALERAVRWVLARPGVFLNTPGDLEVLPRVLDAAANLEPPASQEEMEEDVARLEMKPLFVRGYFGE